MGWVKEITKSQEKENAGGEIKYECGGAQEICKDRVRLRGLFNVFGNPERDKDVNLFKLKFLNLKK